MFYPLMYTRTKEEPRDRTREAAIDIVRRCCEEAMVKRSHGITQQAAIEGKGNVSEFRCFWFHVCACACVSVHSCVFVWRVNINTRDSFRTTAQRCKAAEC